MNVRENADELSKPLAHRLAVMVKASLLTYRDFMPWADTMILRLDSPPAWLCDLACTKFQPSATTILNTYANSDPAEPFSLDELVDEYVASVYMRYERRELSWASFLDLAGREADCSGGRHECEFFYGMLNEYEESNFAAALECEQRQQIVSDYEKVINSVKFTFSAIRKYSVKGC